MIDQDIEIGLISRARWYLFVCLFVIFFPNKCFSSDLVGNQFLVLQHFQAFKNVPGSKYIYITLKCSLTGQKPLDFKFLI